MHQRLIEAHIAFDAPDQTGRGQPKKETGHAMRTELKLGHLTTFGFLIATLITLTCLVLHGSPGLYA